MEIYEEHENELWEELNGQIEAACTELTSDTDDKTIIMGAMRRLNNSYAGVSRSN